MSSVKVLVLTDFKKKLQAWQQSHPEPTQETPAAAPKIEVQKEILAQKPKTSHAEDERELSQRDRLLFLETVVQMGEIQEKPQMQNEVQEHEAVQTVRELHASESELFKKEALEFGLEDIKAHKVPEYKEAYARPDVARRILRGLEEPSVSCDLHGLDREQASQKVHIALSQCHQFDGQVLLIIHGKGQGLLREQVIADLNANVWVADHFVAPAHLGGEGARVIILKKKERRK
jgi:DNA-nicking Smr family endonuclease